MSNTGETAIVPLPVALERLRLAGAELKRASPHPKANTLFGIRAEQLAGLQVVAARLEGKQPALDEDLTTAADRETVAAKAAIQRLSRVASNMRTGSATAEDVIRAVRDEPDTVQARDLLYQLLTRNQTIELDGDVVLRRSVSPDTTGLQVLAAQPYKLRLEVVRTDATTNEVHCRLLGGSNIDAVFEVADIERRFLHFSISDPGTMFTLSSAGAVSVPFEAMVSLVLSVSKKGLSFQCTLIEIMEAQKLADTIHTRFLNELNRLAGF